jgi:hypothetical protein
MAKAARVNGGNGSGNTPFLDIDVAPRVLIL